MRSCRGLRSPGHGLSSLALSFFMAVGYAAADLEQMCGQYDGALTTSGTYLYGTNQWGWDSSGAQCMTVNLDDSTTGYASFNATWSWTERDVWVHSFPNVGYESIQLPTTLSNIKSFVVDAAWNVFPEADPDASNETTALYALGIKADIALDMFMDLDNVTSTNASAAAFEVMVWQAVWGGVAPIGYYTPNDDAPKYNLSGVEYKLFSGFNQQGQQQAVYSWVPTLNQDSINADLFELVEQTITLGNITTDMYLGLIQFGSETVHATSNVTFNMERASMDLQVSSARATPTSTAGGSSATSSGIANNMAVPTGYMLPAAAMGIAAALLV